MKLLEEMVSIHAPAGDEGKMKDFIKNYVENESGNWYRKPELISDEFMHNCLIYKFGTPRTAIFAHIDSIGFTVKYDKELVKIGGPKTEDGYLLFGEDSKGPVEAILRVSEEGKLTYEADREIDRGTSLCFKADFRLSKDFVQSCYLDNRLGVYNALKQAETLKDGLLVFSCWEEHSSGSVNYLARIIQERFQVKQALISDITWVTHGVKHGEGVAISMRDRSIPPQDFVRKIIQLTKNSGIPYQLEVEDAGGSDGSVLQSSPYAFNWCFIGAAEDFVHSPDEKVHLADIDSMLKLYEYLMEKL